MNINERITKVIEHSNLTASEFADEIDVQRSSISHITSGRNKPSLEFITKVKTSFPDIEWEWIITGEGNMLKEKPEEVVEEIPEPSAKKSLPDLFSLIEDDNFGLSEKNETQAQPIVSESTKIDLPINKEEIKDSQRLEESIVKPSHSNIIIPKAVKRIVFFYEDGSFETFQN